MSNTKPAKLFTREKLLIAIIAVAIGASLSLYREFRDTGTIQVSSLVISGITFLIGLGIVMGVGWYANRPEKEDKHV